jgi:hypothetical protein
VWGADAKLTGKLRRDTFAEVGQRETGLIKDDSEKDTEKDENDIDIPLLLLGFEGSFCSRFKVRTCQHSVVGSRYGRRRAVAKYRLWCWVQEGHYPCTFLLIKRSRFEFDDTEC